MKQIVLLFIVFISIHSLGQTFKMDYAQTLTDRLDYQRAFPIWCELAEKELKKENADLIPIRKAAQLAFKMEKFEEALKWDSLLLVKNSQDVSDYLLHAELLCLTKRHHLLQASIEMASGKFKEDPSVRWWVTNYAAILERVQSKSDYSISNFSTKSKGEQFSAVPYEKGILYISTDDDSHPFSSNYNRTGQEFLSICYFNSTEQERYKIWQKAFWQKLIYKNQWRDIEQSGSHDGPIAFSRDRKLAFVTRNQVYWDTINKVKYSRLEQLVYLKNEEKWEELHFPFNNQSHSSGHAVEDTNGWILFVTDNPAFSTGGTDIVKTKLENGKWVEPINLGASVNTVKNELFPFVSSKGTLFFSSNGWPGVGGMDIFETDFFSAEPNHIGSPINSEADDFSFYLNEETGKGYISSNRENWVDKIFSIYKAPYDATLTVELLNCNGMPLSNQSIELTNSKTNKQVVLKTDNKGKVSTSDLEKNKSYLVKFSGNMNSTTDSVRFETYSDGNFNYKLTSSYSSFVSALSFQTEKGEKIENIVLTLYKTDGTTSKTYVSTPEKYVFDSEGPSKLDSVTLEVVNYQDVKFKIPVAPASSCEDTVFYQLVLQRLPDEQYIQITNILYDFDKYSLRPESKIELDKLVNYMQSHPGYKVELQSHTDCRGTYLYNERLSENRSRSCVDYVISKGVSPKMITAKGYGEYQLLENCPCEGEIISTCTEEQHQLNRRTVFLLSTHDDKLLDNKRLTVD
jgi:outer membrane protein OmpA-like peptidoglycan-associated protein